jgi:MAP7 domain-containing protein 1
MWVQTASHREASQSMLQNFSDEFSLYDCGSGGMAELKNKIDDLQQVYIAFCREQVNMEPTFLLINYIPPCVSGVRRGRYM